LSAPDQKSPVGLDLRVIAAERLRLVLDGARFTPLTAAEIVDGRDRGLANKLITTALRRHGHLDRVLAYLLDRGMPKKSGSFEAVLRLALAQLLYLPELGDHSALFLAVEALKRDPKTTHLPKLANAVLRRAQSEAGKLREAPPELLFPETLRKRWKKDYDPATIAAFAAALLAGAPLDLTLRDDEPALVVALGGIPTVAGSVRVDNRDSTVEELPGYTEGRWWVQDVAASLPARLLRLPAGARVLDLCAAPGGKTAQLLKAGYAVTALDEDAGRLTRLNANLARLGYAATVIQGDAASYAPEEKFDAVLLDAPCSATGTFRRHPEVVWHREAADIANRLALQRKMITNAAQCLKPGGILVYCVCSLEFEEGEGQAKWAVWAIEGLELLPVEARELDGFAAAVSPKGFLRTHPGMAIPGADGTLDGFFAARFRTAIPTV
jgi:16S rRNA (cytosine967-C5)-methyltransferase